MPEATIQVTVRVPQELYERVYVAANKRFLSGTSPTSRQVSMAAWFLEAAREKLEREVKDG